MKGVNTLVASDAGGGEGADVVATFDVYVDMTCAGSTSTPAAATQPIAITAGGGGRGGSSGAGQGADQGEDQGENIGQYATGNTVVGPVRVWARNSIASGSADGGSGGSVNVVYNDFGTCMPDSTPATTVAERARATGGAGGAAGSTGSGQGADQGEDQGENVGQYASGHARIGSVSVSADNSNLAGDARGGTGGSVRTTYHSGSCTSPVASSSQLVDGTGGNGGAGGTSGKNQGADQGEDQGENVGQHAARFSSFGRVTIAAVNSNVSGDVSGGDGGDVTTSCSPAAAPDSRVLGAGGSGGAAGSSGNGQGSDQGEDQGENIGLRASSVGRGRVSVTAVSTNTSGHARAGAPGAYGCAGERRALSLSLARPRQLPRPLDPDIKACDGTFAGRVIDVLVRSGSVCTLAPGARVRHDVLVEPGGALIDRGALIGHDLTAYRAAGVAALGGSAATTSRSRRSTAR